MHARAESKIAIARERESRPETKMNEVRENWTRSGGMVRIHFVTRLVLWEAFLLGTGNGETYPSTNAWVCRFLPVWRKQKLAHFCCLCLHVRTRFRARQAIRASKRVPPPNIYSNCAFPRPDLHSHLPHASVTLTRPPGLLMFVVFFCWFLFSFRRHWSEKSSKKEASTLVACALPTFDGDPSEGSSECACLRWLCMGRGLELLLCYSFFFPSFVFFHSFYCQCNESLTCFCCWFASFCSLSFFFVVEGNREKPSSDCQNEVVPVFLFDCVVLCLLLLLLKIWEKTVCSRVCACDGDFIHAKEPTTTDPRYVGPQAVFGWREIGYVCFHLSLPLCAVGIVSVCVCVWVVGCSSLV